jgi:hypothetical protein
MIFNEMNSSVAAVEAVNESPYELGIAGALMHVYENECNYNALMKAAALSEMKYYNENGGNLFVQEAGAFSSLWEKVKAFFKKVVEKIKSICKKFVAMINQHAMKDKDFVKKYSKDLYRVNLNGFEFEGYEFAALKGQANLNALNMAGGVWGHTVDGITAASSVDDVNDKIEENRGGLVKGGKITESELREELHEMLYGDKDTITDVKIRDFLSIISDHNTDVKAAEKAQDSVVKGIEADIKKMEKDIETLGKEAVKEDDGRENSIKLFDKKIQIYKAYCNDITIFYGAYVKALNDRNRQAKAVCVKALSYKPKNEAAVAENAGYANIFAGVEII